MTFPITHANGEIVDAAWANDLESRAAAAIAAAGAGSAKVVALGNITGTVTCDLSQGTCFTGTQTGNVTVNFSNWPAAPALTEPLLIFAQNGTGGWTITITGVIWEPAGTTPTFDTTATHVNIIPLSSPDQGAHLYGVSGVVGALLAANNLSDLSNAATARTNLGLGSAAVAAIDATAGDFQPSGFAAAGATGKVADAGHVHPSYPSYVQPANGSLGRALAGWNAAKAAAGTTPAIIGIFGDSIAGGYTLTDGITNGYPNRLKQLLIAAGFGWYGEAYTMAPYAENTKQIANTRFGAWVNTNGHQLDAGLGRVIYDNLSGATMPLETITIPSGAVACDIICLAYAAGTWKYQVDAGSLQTVTVTPTTGGNTQQNAVFYKVTIALSSNSTIKIGTMSAGLVLMPSLVAFRYGTTGIGMIVNTCPAGSAADLAAGAGANTASAVVSATPGISAPDDRMQPWAQVTTSHNTAGAGWPLNPNLAIIAYYANAIGRGSDPNAERRALERLCRSIRAGNDAVSFVFLINNIPDQVYAASTYETTLFVAERASRFKALIHEVSRAVGGVVVDIDQKWGETGVSQGFLPANNVHPTGTGATSSDGHYDIAQAIFSIL